MPDIVVGKGMCPICKGDMKRKLVLKPDKDIAECQICKCPYSSEWTRVNWT